MFTSKPANTVTQVVPIAQDRAHLGPLTSQPVPSKEASIKFFPGLFGTQQQRSSGPPGHPTPGLADSSISFMQEVWPG